MKECQGEQNKHIRKGSKVVVISGDDRGAKGVVLSRTQDRAVVQGVNVCKKHVKKSEAHPKGAIVEIERAIHLSKLKPLNEKGEAVKARVRVNDKGERELFYTEDQQDVVLRPLKKSN